MAERAPPRNSSLRFLSKRLRKLALRSKLPHPKSGPASNCTEARIGFRSFISTPGSSLRRSATSRSIRSCAPKTARKSRLLMAHLLEERVPGRQAAQDFSVDDDRGRDGHAVVVPQRRPGRNPHDGQPLQFLLLKGAPAASLAGEV